jgi:hypothetical protein
MENLISHRLGAAAGVNFVDRWATICDVTRQFFCAAGLAQVEEIAWQVSGQRH